MGRGKKGLYKGKRMGHKRNRKIKGKGQLKGNSCGREKNSEGKEVKEDKGFKT